MRSSNSRNTPTTRCASASAMPSCRNVISVNSRLEKNVSRTMPVMLRSISKWACRRLRARDRIFSLGKVRRAISTTCSPSSTSSSATISNFAVSAPAERSRSGRDGLPKYTLAPNLRSTSTWVASCSSAMKGMPWVRSTRPTICPTRPNPQMMTGAFSSIVSNFSAFRLLRRGMTNFSLAANISGVAAIDTAITNVAWSAVCWVSALTATAAANSTKLNSLPWGRAAAKRMAFAQSCPAIRPSISATTTLDSISAATPPRIHTGWLPSRVKSASMPTDMKKKPSSSPSNGSMSACNSCRYSESDSSTPAMNAPSDMDSPASLARKAVPTTMSRAVAVNTSGVRAPPIRRNTTGTRNRPPIRMVATVPTASITERHGT